MKKYQYLLSVLFMLPLMLFTSCLDKEDAAPTALLKKWNLKVIAYTDKADLLPPQGEQVWIEFGKQKASSGYSFYGVAAPNSYSGNLTLTNEGTKGGKLVGNMAVTMTGSTRMLGTMLGAELEYEYFKLLELAKSYSIQHNTLTLYCRNGEKLIYTSEAIN